jgi:hypothetical protein
MKTTARLNLEQPHLVEHRASIAASMGRGRQPKGPHQLMAWFLEEWQRELPSRTHKAEVWRDYVGFTEDRMGQGGSLLGTPAYAELFRRYIEGSPFETDPDGRYVRPIHAAIARLCGRRGHDGPTPKLDNGPFMARFLFRLAHSGDLGHSAASMGIPAQVQLIYAEQALYRLWRVYEVAPGAMGRAA